MTTAINDQRNLMVGGRKDIDWGRRVPKHKIRRLYELDAQGIVDEALIDDVGIALLVRCESIVTIHEARQGRVKCPRCTRRGATTIIPRSPHRKGDPRDEVISCSVCGWTITWGDYVLSFKRKQLNSGGALLTFQDYVQRYKTAHTPRCKLLAIDRLIHEFHYSLAHQPALPTRPVGCNLIQGKMTDVIAFLNKLTYGERTTRELVEGRERWQRTLETHERGTAHWRRRDGQR